MAWYDVVGLVGVVAILAGYFLLQQGRLGRDDMVYSVLNAVGSAAILLSLVYDFNLSALVIEGLWLVISLYGIARLLMGRSRERRRHEG